MAYDQGRAQGSGQTQSTGLLITICDQVAQQAGTVDEGFGELQRSITSAWDGVVNDLPSLSKGRLERRDPYYREQDAPGFMVLDARTQQALSALRELAENPFTYVEDQQDRARIDGTIAQILPPLMQQLDKSHLSVPAPARQAIREMSAAGASYPERSQRPDKA